MFCVEMSKKKDEDLISLGADAGDKQIVELLGDRFAKDNIYTRIGQKIVVSVNPYKPIELCSDSTAKNIGNAVKDGKDRQPHVFEVAASAYFDMLKDKQNQSLFFIGQTGSGKSEAFDLATRELVLLSKSKSKENKTHVRLLKTLQVLEAFGHAKTSLNDNSSRYGKYVEVQFNNRGKFSGAKVCDYLLEKSRVTSVPFDERSFHVFYYLITGSSTVEKANYHLLEAKNYRFLSSSKSLKASSINDVAKFVELKSSLKAAGFKEKYQNQIFQLLAAILLLGNVQFEDAESKDDAAIISNIEVLKTASEMLGVRSHYLENALVYKTKVIKKELCTLFLDTVEASEQRDSLCQTLYGLLWSWILESVNKKLVDEEAVSHIALIDLFGLENHKDNYFHQLLYNYTAERIQGHLNQSIFDDEINLYRNEKVKLPQISYNDNVDIVNLLYGKPGSVLNIFDEESAKTKKRAKTSALITVLNEAHSSNDNYVAFSKKSGKSNLFGIKHHGEEVFYDAKDFLQINSEHVSPDFITLFRGGPETRASKNSFVFNLFCQKSLDVEKAPDGTVVVDALQLDGPRRHPTLKNKSSKPTEKSETLFSHYRHSLDEVFEAVGETNQNFVLCIAPNLNQAPSKFALAAVEHQVQNFGLSDIVQIRSQGYGQHYTYQEFLERYAIAANETGSSSDPKVQATAMAKSIGLSSSEFFIGSSMVFVSEQGSRQLDLSLRAAEKTERKRIKDKLSRGVDESSNIGSQITDDQSDIADTDFENYQGSDTEFSETDDDRRSVASFGSEFSLAQDDKDAALQGDKQLELQVEEEEELMSSIRKTWLQVTTVLTWWVPTRCLEWNGMKRSDIQQAWREKLALCILILLLSALMLFFIIGFNKLLCPSDKMFRLTDEMGQYSSREELYVAVHGHVFDYTTARNTHSGGAEFIDEYGGRDATAEFPRKPDLCGLEVDPTVDYLNKTSFAHAQDTSLAILSPKNKKMWKGYLAYKRDDIKKNYGKPDKWYVIVNKKIYDFTVYRQYNQKYLGDSVSAIALQFGGNDATDAWDRLKASERKAALSCMDTIHFAGVVDERDSPQCYFAEGLLLGVTGILVAIMVVKFLSALQLGTKSTPENNDRFVLMQVPCYTEGEESLRRTLESLATLRYDDKRKLLFLVADGNIVGSGNDRATWRIALDILGVDPSIDPPKLSFQSLGEGNRQHNMGKVYTGLYDCQGHLVPYVVVVKVGKDNETRRPGNRGKRDSQLILMRFLQKVHYDEAMSPLELEMFHQIKNVIGVDPSFYEFVLMVDADTEVVADSLNRLVSSMVHDSKVVGICGETTIANERDSLITMIQVYEYYISHYLAKAFESMFGSVTCLPGCFCMYRIRTPGNSIPLLTSKPVIEDYSLNDVDTLHKKNLLSLGEDRYLTTLMLKHFPNMKISFTGDAQCKTYVPDRWSVLLSQRRRWINSTVHNLLELLLLPQLCGFCCFSMRFVVFFDLFATLVMPATMGYIGFLIYTVFTGRILPIITLIMLVAGYGLQAVIFIVKGKWEHIGWLIIYILALPFFTLILPVYAFWHFDDFSWGNTRVVVGERGGKKHIVDEEPFDPASIPMKKWSDYESEMWEKDSQVSAASKGMTIYSGLSHQQPPSVYGSAVYPGSGVMPPVSQMGYAPQPMIQKQASTIGMPQLPADGLPTEDQIRAQVKTILATANLMTVTKKQVRDDLTAFFGVEMNPKKEFINKVIEDVLQGKL